MTHPRSLTGIVLMVLCVSALSHAAEKKIPKSSLPRAVARTAEQQSQGAPVRGDTQDSENGQVEYEVEMTVSGHSKDVSIGADGSVLEGEEQVEIGARPAAGRAGLE